MNEPTPPERNLSVWTPLCQRFSAGFPTEVYGCVGIVLAISGGADSVALARLVVQAWQGSTSGDLNLVTLAHFNHRLRGEASDGDEQFVQQLAQQLQVDLVTESRQDGIATATDEAALRDQRYDFLRRTMAARGARCLVTAHNADDQIETVLHHLFRGTGPAGMCGIPIRRQIDEDFLLVRPLIGFRGELLRDALREIDQPWREDHTNAEIDYSRNWIRRELLPLVRTRYRSADESILRLVDTQRGWHQLIAAQAQQWIESNVTIADQCVRVLRGPVESAIVGLAVATLWDRMGWPRRDLSANHYRAIHSLITLQTSLAITLPGDVQCSVDCDAGGETRVSFRRGTQRR